MSILFGLLLLAFALGFGIGSDLEKWESTRKVTGTVFFVTLALAVGMMIAVRLGE